VGPRCLESTTTQYLAALSLANLTVNDAPSLDLTTGLTVEAWVNPSTLNSPDLGWVAAVAKEHQNSDNDIAYALDAAASARTPTVTAGGPTPP
jgi:hypothetical protein